MHYYLWHTATKQFKVNNSYKFLIYLYQDLDTDNWITNGEISHLHVYNEYQFLINTYRKSLWP